MTVRTRFAPSPTGRLHLGNVRAAAFNWLFARRHGGAFILRIEDTDVVRNVEGGEAEILEDLRWLGLHWDEGPDIGGPHGPYRQSERGPVYAAALGRLQEAGHVYPCFCADKSDESEGGPTVEDVDRDGFRYPGTCRTLSREVAQRRVASGETHVLRFAVPRENSMVEVRDRIFGEIRVPSDDVDDFVVRRSDGRVTYNFAVVVDDVDMRISHVIRGVGHLSNTPKQALLFDALGVGRPEFAHLPTVLGPDGRKLSKREGAVAVAALRARGYPPEAVLNYLSLLGWSHPDEREILTRDELVEAVSLDRVGRSDTQMDPEKLRWVASRYLAEESTEALAAHVAPFIDPDRFPQAVDRLVPVVDALRSRFSTYAEIEDQLGLLFPDEAVASAGRRAVAATPEGRAVLEAVVSALREVDRWEPEALGVAIREAGARAGVRGAALFHPVRRVLIGSEQGPDLGKILAAIGPEEAVLRFSLALQSGDEGTAGSSSGLS